METLIKQALKALGLDEALWTKISVASETEIEGAVKKLARTEREEKIKGALKKEGLDNDYDKHVQSLIDQRVTEALKTQAEKLEATRLADAETKRIADEKAAEDAKKLKEAEEAKKLGDTDKDKEISELKIMLSQAIDKVDTLATEVTDLKSGITEKTTEQIVNAAIKEAGLTPNWAKFVTEKDPEKIKEQVAGLKVQYTTERQIENDKIIANGGTPARGALSDTVADQAVADHAKKQGVGVTEVSGLASKQVLASNK